MAAALVVLVHWDVFEDAPADLWTQIGAIRERNRHQQASAFDAMTSTSGRPRRQLSGNGKAALYDRDGRKAAMPPSRVRLCFGSQAEQQPLRLVTSTLRRRTSKAFPVRDRLIPATAELCGFDMIGDYVLVPDD